MALETDGDRRGSGGQVVVVTGASAGVGRATVRVFAREGARIGLLARDPARLEDTRREVEELGGEAVAIPTDVADAGQVEAAARRVDDAFGPVDVWVNNAMSTVFSPFMEMSADEFRRATEVTYLGYVYGTRSALARMKPRNRGTIVQVGSALAYRSIPLQSAYCGAKAAIRGFTDSIRCELLHDDSDVHITMVQLPAVNTPQFEWCRNYMDGQPQPVPPIYGPEVAGRAVAWAATAGKREVWVGGSAVMTILGQRILPGLMDRYLARTGYESQIVEGTQDQPGNRRAGNLFQPVEAPLAAHGRFDDESHDRSPQLAVSRNRKWVALGLGLAGLGLLAGVQMNGRDR